MESGKLFFRDPREVPFLRGHLVRTLSLANQSSRGISVREDDDFGFMTVQFLYKQLQHAESILMLLPGRDAGLVGRTMIEGLYQLLWTYQMPEERAKRWRSFSVIHDWRLIHARLNDGIPVDEAIQRQNEVAISEFGHLHEVKKPKPNSSDPYHKNWRGGTSLSEMADAVGRELYDMTYSDLSDWGHWGVSGIGEALSREGSRILINASSERVAGQSLLAAYQCVFQTLQIADYHLKLNISDAIQELHSDFMETMDSFRHG